MLGVKRERHIERLDHIGVGHRREAHVKEVRGEAKGGIRRNGRTTLAAAKIGGHRRRDPGEKAHRLAPGGLGSVIGGLGVLEP